MIDESESASWLDESKQLSDTNTASASFSNNAAENYITRNSRKSRSLEGNFSNKVNFDGNDIGSINSSTMSSAKSVSRFVAQSLTRKKNPRMRKGTPQCVGQNLNDGENSTSGSISSEENKLHHSYSVGSAALSSGKSIGRYVAKSIANENSKPPKKRERFHCLQSNRRDASENDDENKNEEILKNQIQVQDGRIANLENTLELVYKKIKLHEDNIDELQEKLYLVEFGTPGTFLASCRFYIALFKCTAIPIIIVEVIYRVIFAAFQ